MAASSITRTFNPNGNKKTVLMKFTHTSTGEVLFTGLRNVEFAVLKGNDDVDLSVGIARNSKTGGDDNTGEPGWIAISGLPSGTNTHFLYAEGY